MNILNKYSHVLWDFNGTILNDVQTGILSANELLKTRNLKLINSKEEYQNVFGFPIIDYYRRLGLDFEKESFDDLAVEWVAYYNHYFEKATLNQGILDTISYLNLCGVCQIVLSATEINMLKGQLETLKIESYFQEVLGLDNINAESKVSLGVQWVNRVKPKSAILIGDTIHDFEVAKAMGIDCLLVATGHQSKEKLLQTGCKVLNSIKETERG